MPRMPGESKKRTEDAGAWRMLYSDSVSLLEEIGLREDNYEYNLPTTTDITITNRHGHCNHQTVVHSATTTTLLRQLPHHYQPPQTSLLPTNRVINSSSHH